MNNYWENLTKEKWDTVSYPYRPKKQDLVFLNGLEKNKKIILFGATPEIRIILSKSRHSVTIFDVSKQCVEQMGRYVEDKTLETYIYGDWLTYQLQETYDYVIGDLVFNIVKQEDHQKLEQIIKRLGTPGAKFFFRTLTKKEVGRLFLATSNLSMLILFLSCINHKINAKIFHFLNRFFNNPNKGTQIVFLN